jgi:hypothetical protein
MFKHIVFNNHKVLSIKISSFIREWLNGFYTKFA